jgi:hypothetical protein
VTPDEPPPPPRRRLSLVRTIALLVALACVVLSFLPVGLLGDDPTSGYATAILVASAFGMALALATLLTPAWIASALEALLIQAGLVALLIVLGLVRHGDTGPALMAVLLAIVFPGLALTFAGLLRLVWVVLSWALTGRT